MENLNISNADVTSQSARETFIDSFDDNAVEQQANGSITDEQETKPNIEGNQEVNSEEPEIDEKFQHLPKYEALVRTFQSRADQYKAELDKTKLEMQDKSKYIEALDLILEDDDVFNAFVKERKPELIKEQDFSSQLKEKLSKEFPEINEGVRYTRAEADDEPGGKAWLYFKRLDELYSELRGQNGAKYQTLKDAIISKKKERQESEAKRQAELSKGITEIKQVLKWDDNQIKSFYDNITKASLVTLARMYSTYMQLAQKSNQTNIPTSTGTPLTPSARQKFLDGL